VTSFPCFLCRSHLKNFLRASILFSVFLCSSTVFPLRHFGSISSPVYSRGFSNSLHMGNALVILHLHLFLYIFYVRLCSWTIGKAIVIGQGPPQGHRCDIMSGALNLTEVNSLGRILCNTCCGLTPIFLHSCFLVYSCLTQCSTFCMLAGRCWRGEGRWSLASTSRWFVPRSHLRSRHWKLSGKRAATLKKITWQVIGWTICQYKSCWSETGGDLKDLFHREKPFFSHLPDITDADAAHLWRSRHWCFATNLESNRGWTDGQ